MTLTIPRRWSKHGTCISTLKTSCYTNYQTHEELVDFLSTTVSLFKTLPTYDWLSAAGITPSSSKTYTTAAIQAALSKQHGYNVYLGCSGSTLDEVWYFFNVQGSVQTGTFVAAPLVGSASTCPSTGIKYLPKTGGSGTVTTTTSGGSTKTTTASTSTSTSGSGSGFSGKGTLNVVTGGSTDGCIISGGTWYTSGTCASFTAASSGSGFTLTSSKGACAIVSGALSCASGNTATVFTSSGSNLVYSGSSTFYTDSVPSGSTQATVYTSSSHSTSFTIQWASS